MTDAVYALLAKKEVTYGTDAVPTPAANAVLIRNFSATPVQTDRLERPLERGTWGAQKAKATNERQALQFEVELSGSGAAGTAPKWMTLLEGCGMAAPVLVAATDAKQRFGKLQDPQSSLSTRYYVGDQLHKGVGARGSWSLDMTAGSLPYFAIAMTALIPAVTPFSTSALVGADFTGWPEPVEVNSLNTSIMLDGFAVITRSLRIEAGVNTNLRNLVGSRYVNRGPHAAQLTLVIEAPSISVKDYITALREGSLIALAVTHGTAAGNIIEIAAPAVQIAEIAESQEDGKRMWTLSGPITVDQAADELVITAK